MNTRTLIWFIYFWADLVRLIPARNKARRLLDEGRTEEADAIVQQEVRRWCQALLRLAGVRLTVSGLENIPAGPVVFVSNHQGNFDIPILLSGLERAHPLLAKIELRRIPLVRDWMVLLDCIFVDRGSARSAMTAVGEAEALLSSGKSIVIFPEGTRSRGEMLGEFKAGAFKVAQRVGAPLVPVSIEGSYRVMEANKNWIHPASVRLTVLPPVETAQLDRAAFKALPDQIRELILASRTQQEDTI